MKPIVKKIETAHLKTHISDFRPGDTVRVDVEIIEGESRRVQAFEGVVLRKRGHGVSATFTVRKTSFGVGIERTFPLHSPRIQSITRVRTGDVRRARLYYLRELSGKAARIGEKSVAVSAAPATAASPVATPPVAAPDPRPAASAV